MARLTHRLGALLVVAVLAASCGDDGGAGDPQRQTEPTTEPQAGGSLTVGAFASINGFDPIFLAGSGSNGAIELAALYDTLVRWDPVERTYVPGTASTFGANDDATVWTVEIRPEITFSDGTPYDAEAVKFNVERHVSKESRSPSKRTLENLLESVEVVDELTVQFNLKDGWGGFPYLLARDLGMIASPAAIEKAGADFAVNPGKAGAGPFVLESFKPGEAIVMRRNEDYYRGDVFLDQLTFIVPSSPAVAVESLKSGELDGAYLRDPEAIDEIKQAGIPALESIAPLGNIAQMNLGVEVTCASGEPAPECTGKPDGTEVPTNPPTADIRVRQAVAAAIDAEVVNQRVWGGKAEASKDPFTESFPWDPDVEGPAYDPDAARELVAEAKADGWDGRIRVLAASDNREWALAITTLLEAVGMDVQADTSKDIGGVVQQMLVNRNFDIASWAYGLQDDDGNYPQFFINLSSASPRYGYSSREMDAGIDQLREALTDNERRAAYSKIAEALVEDLPSVPIAPLTSAWAHSPRVHGVKRSAATIILFDEVWLEQ